MRRLRRYSRSPSPEGRLPTGDKERSDRNLPPPPRNMPPPPPMLDKPEQFGVYRGRVSNVMEFGCFVELLGFRTKAEGLVHLANMAKTRCAHRPIPDAHQSVYIVLNSRVCPPMIAQTMVPMYTPTVS